MSKKKPPKKMTLRPGDIEKAREEFISEPNHKTEQRAEEIQPDPEPQVDPQIRKKAKPWDGLIERVPKPMSVRLSEVDQAKLDYILANTTHKSKHKFCMGAIKRAINRALKEID